MPKIYFGYSAWTFFMDPPFGFEFESIESFRFLFHWVLNSVFLTYIGLYRRPIQCHARRNLLSFSEKNCCYGLCTYFRSKKFFQNYRCNISLWHTCYVLCSIFFNKWPVLKTRSILFFCIYSKYYVQIELIKCSSAIFSLYSMSLLTQVSHHYSNMYIQFFYTQERITGLDSSNLTISFKAQVFDLKDFVNFVNFFLVQDL